MCDVFIRFDRRRRGVHDLLCGYGDEFPGDEVHRASHGENERKARKKTKTAGASDAPAVLYQRGVGSMSVHLSRNCGQTVQ